MLHPSGGQFSPECLSWAWPPCRSIECGLLKGHLSVLFLPFIHMKRCLYRDCCLETRERGGMEGPTGEGMTRSVRVPAHQVQSGDPRKTGVGGSRPP